MNEKLLFALTMAQEASEIARHYFYKNSLSRELKKDESVVTEADLMVDHYLTSMIKSEYPDHGILSEESGSNEVAGDYVWCLDPIDGTSNFSVKLPYFSISIALLHQGKPVVGVIEAPLLGDTYYAAQGLGAYKNGKKIRVTNETSVFNTIFSVSITKASDKDFNLFRTAMTKNMHWRTLGSAALELAHCAEGKIHLAFQKNLSPWDWAAGMILIEEAGGQVMTEGGELFEATVSKTFVGSNSMLLKRFSELSLSPIQENGESLAWNLGAKE